MRSDFELKIEFFLFSLKFSLACKKIKTPTITSSPVNNSIAITSVLT